MGGDETKGQYEAACTTYASQGFVVYNIDYRLANLNTGGSQWPDQIGDVQLAVRTIERWRSCRHSNAGHALGSARLVRQERIEGHRRFL